MTRQNKIPEEATLSPVRTGDARTGADNSTTSQLPQPKSDMDIFTSWSVGVALRSWNNANKTGSRSSRESLLVQ